MMLVKIKSCAYDFHRSGGRRIGVEFKRTSVPKMTRSMNSALAHLGLDRIFVLFPGRDRFRLHERVEAVGLQRACAEGLD